MIDVDAKLAAPPESSGTGRYEVLVQVTAGLGDRRTELGTRGGCRFCRRTDGVTFRQVAHTFPEALGNHWVISLDECDACNALFSRYEGALADAVAPLLTIGGTKGKGNRIRQTGRSAGASVLQRVEDTERPRISGMASVEDFSRHFGFDPETGRLILDMPVASVPFRPRLAYKALCKMAYALLPAHEIEGYEKIRSWLQETEDGLDFPFLDVGLSFGSVGNAPPIVAGTLLRRTHPEDRGPHIIFVLTAGSVCLQIDLMSDHMEDHLLPVPMGTVNLAFTSVCSDGDGADQLSISYGAPTHLDWKWFAVEPQPVEAFRLLFDLKTTEGTFVPIMR